MRATRVLLLGLIAGCGAAQLSLPDATLPSGPEGRRVESMTDLETVHGVVQQGDVLLAATSHGLYRWRGGGAAERLVRAECWAVAFAGSSAVALCEGGLVDAEGTVLLGPAGLPSRARHLHATTSALFIGGDTGLMVATPGTPWGSAPFADAAAVTGIWPGAEGAFWVGTARGLLRVSGATVEEHAAGRGLGGAHVRSVASVAPGRVLALVQDSATSDARLAYFDGVRWFTYTLAEFTTPVVGLASDRTGPILATTRGLIRLGAGAGVRLTSLSAGEPHQVLRYRGAGAPTAPPAPPNAVPIPRSVRLAAVPAQQATVEAPEWTATPVASAAPEAVFTVGADVLVAESHCGLRSLEGREYRTGSLVAGGDLQLAISRQGTLIRTASGDLGLWREGRWRALSAPPGLRVMAIASSSSGAFAVAMDDGGQVLTLQLGAQGWRTLDRRRLLVASEATGDAEEEAVAADAAPQEMGDAPAPALRLAAISHFGVRDDGEVWLGISVDDGSGPRPRGVAVYRPNDAAITYHHSQSDPAVDGAGSLRMPDAFENMDLGEAGMAWFSTLVGAVRLGNSQAVTFGEARGVRGEVVSDVLVGTAAKVWMAAAEGPGYYFRQRFEFRMPANVVALRPRSLALGQDGSIWAAGGGLARYSNDQWTVYEDRRDEDGNVIDGDGIDEPIFVDVETDGAGNVWVLGEQALHRISTR
ncbi:MAG: hypothetical protein AAF938_09115 [Myxococcota bacterium]